MNAETVSPAEITPLLGHSRQEAHVFSLFQQNHLPHALLIAGPKGIGKSLFAMRIAAFLLTQQIIAPKVEEQGGGLFGDMDFGAAPKPKAVTEGLAVPLEHPIHRRIAAGGHPDFLMLRPEFDERKKEFKAEIPVEESRRVSDFMSLTPAEGAWRVVVIDSVDELNRNAANALLKVLEEPPAKAILILISHNPAQLLPTIRSRCQVVTLATPNMKDFMQIITQRQPAITESDGKALAQLSGMSPGRTLMLHEAGGIATYSALVDWARRYPTITIADTQAFIDAHLKKEGDQSWKTLGWLVDTFLARLQKAATGCSVGDEIAHNEWAVLRKFSASRPADEWFAIWEKSVQLWGETSRLYLDKRLVLQQTLFDLTFRTSMAA